MADFMVVHQEGTGDELLLNLDAVSFARRKVSESREFTILELQDGETLSVQETYNQLVQRTPRQSV